jgi:hypothetical protein
MTLCPGQRLLIIRLHELLNLLRRVIIRFAYAQAMNSMTAAHNMKLAEVRDDTKTLNPCGTRGAVHAERSQRDGEYW